MNAVLPFVIAAVLFPVSFLQKRYKNSLLVVVPAALLGITFVVLAVVGPEDRYVSAFVALVAFSVAGRGALAVRRKGRDDQG